MCLKRLKAQVSKPLEPYSPCPNSSCLSSSVEAVGDSRVRRGEVEHLKRRKEIEELPLLALLVALFRKTFIICKTGREELCTMEIGWPTNVRHVAHVTFDKFNGFLGLPVEFEPEVPRRAPSASTSVFGVSTESMQLSCDSRGNCVPTILLLMQRRLYAQGGLQAEGIFRINAENSQEEFLRDQLNRGIVPEDIDVHCLAGLIKAWFRELPSGILDPLSPEQVMQCESADDCVELVMLLPLTEAALLGWAINLMADVVQEEHLNKMNAHNVAMVFAPNMAQMADPLTALMHVVRVMNFLKTLIMKTLQERRDRRADPASAARVVPYDETDNQSSSQPRLADYLANDNQESDDDVKEHYSTADETAADSSLNGSRYEEDESDEPTFQPITLKAASIRLVNWSRPKFRSRPCNGMIGESSDSDITGEFFATK
ncbi:hypothetical protein Nepgr_014505 [Nepenthes gracilis]|uniref:Uncharacterized protein n=1 Tax=Nepenthes gracilis TaxID=150966 RepID=A0AAD3SKX3_NEPGR|nr:hypothetical protein Nepgr_014505 [Nepenthes gracilis]